MTGRNASFPPPPPSVSRATELWILKSPTPPLAPPPPPAPFVSRATEVSILKSSTPPVAPSSLPARSLHHRLEPGQGPDHRSGRARPLPRVPGTTAGGSRSAHRTRAHPPDPLPHRLS